MADNRGFYLRSPFLIVIALTSAMGGIATGCGPDGREVLSMERTPKSDFPDSSMVNHAEFRLLAPTTWTPAPDSPGSEHTEFISLSMINRSSDPVQFNRFDTFRLSLTDSQGKEVPLDGGRDATRPAPTLSPPIPQDGTHEIRLPAGLIETSNGREYRLEGTEEFGGVWYFDGLSAGTYSLRGIYENRKSQIGDTGPVWTGTAVTPPLEVTFP